MKAKGFTLIELLLYISIISIIAFTITNGFYLTFQSRVENTTMSEVEEQAEQIMALITQTIRNALAINSPATGSSSSTLSLTVKDGASSPTIFDLSGGAVRITEGTLAAVVLNSSRVTASGLTFHNVSRASTPGVIRIQFTLSYNSTAVQNEYSYTKTFYASAALRKY